MERELWPLVYRALRAVAQEVPDAKGTPLGHGYKLHTIWGDGVLPEAWEVTAPRNYKGAVAERLLRQVRGCGVLLADGNSEASRMYDAAAASGYQLLAPPDDRDTGTGHHYQSPGRLVALRRFADGLGWDLYRERASIERSRTPGRSVTGWNRC